MPYVKSFVRNGVLYDPNNAPFDAPPDAMYLEGAEGTTPAEACRALITKMGK
jgi:hypothetical protein